MTKEVSIKKTIKTLNMLPQEKVIVVADFADFILKKYEEYILQNGVEKTVEVPDAFQFLNNEEELYTLADIKEKY